MAIYKRGENWWIDFTAPGGGRIRRSAGTQDKRQAQELHDTLRAEAWRQSQLKERPRHTWGEAVIRWVRERAHKATLHDDQMHLRFVSQHWPEGLMLDEISRDHLDKLKAARQATGVSAATVNRMLACVRAILRQAARDWEWTDRAPSVRLLPEPRRRVRWITREEADRLLAELPQHLRDMAAFSLSTGLREANVTGLEWAQIDLARRSAWVHADQAKARKPIPVPLNADAMAILRRLQGAHPTYVFTFEGHSVTRANNHAWRKALARAGIENFSWHDLRHTWASWHVQAGTPLHVLQELGGWASLAMVLRYAHLGSDHLAEHAARIAGPRAIANGTSTAQRKK